MDIYEMQIVKVGPNLRERATRFVARQHHHSIVQCLRRYRETLETDMAPELWVALEAPAVILLSDVCDALHLTAAEKAEVLGQSGQAMQYSLLESHVMPQTQPLNERQVKAMLHVQQSGHITNRAYQQVCPTVSPETLRLDLVDLVRRGLLQKHGNCRGTYYTALV